MSSKLSMPLSARATKTRGEPRRQLRERGGEPVEGAAHAARQHAAALGQEEALPCALDEGAAALALELADGLGDSGLRDIAAPRRHGHRPRLGHGEEYPKMAQIAGRHRRSSNRSARASRSSAPGSAAAAATASCHSTAARLIRSGRPRAFSVAAASRISAARRSP